MKHKACAECGVASFSCELPETATQEEVLAAVEKFNKDDAVHGILVQLPVS
jgi:methylenetetrahydrofolate dehydrogenase (NADP+)/methenyltetrahydrofolate cyclohydrolase